MVILLVRSVELTFEIQSVFRIAKYVVNSMVTHLATSLGMSVVVWWGLR